MIRLQRASRRPPGGSQEAPRELPGGFRRFLKESEGSYGRVYVGKKLGDRLPESDP